MGRRGKRNDGKMNFVDEVMDELNDGDVKIDDVREELRDILTELEIYQRTWMMPWFVQRLLDDLYMRLSLLVDKLGRGM